MFRWLKQTDASFTSWTECHTPSQTARHWTSTESSSDSSGAELRGRVSSDESAARRRLHWIRGEAGSCYLQRHSPSLRLRLLLFHTTFWFDPRQKDLTEVRTEAEGERRIRFLLWCIECGCSVGWSRCSFFFFYCFRLVSSSQLTWSPLHSVIISLPCSHFLLWGENQPDSVASSSSSSIHLSTFQQRLISTLTDPPCFSSSHLMASIRLSSFRDLSER